jgi:hypothetical protein
VNTLIVWIQHIPEYQRPHSLDTMLIGIVARWWDVHLQPYQEWVIMVEVMCEQFSIREIVPHITYICARGWLAKKWHGAGHIHLNILCAHPNHPPIPPIPKKIVELTWKPPKPTLETISQFINLEESFREISSFFPNPMEKPDKIDRCVDEIFHQWILQE